MTNIWESFPRENNPLDGHPVGAYELHYYIHACPWSHKHTPFTDNYLTIYDPITDTSRPLNL